MYVNLNIYQEFFLKDSYAKSMVFVKRNLLRKQDVKYLNVLILSDTSAIRLHESLREMERFTN